MGLYYQGYIGPYIKVKSPLMDGINKKKVCSNQGCSNRKEQMTSPFCPKCGKAIIEKEFPIKKQVAYEVYDETDERLSEVHYEWHGLGKEIRIFRGNVDFPTVDGRDPEFASESLISEYNASMITTEIQLFRRAFAKEIARIEEVFGKDNVTIPWGIVAYCS